jgi:hypothetical protein
VKLAKVTDEIIGLVVNLPNGPYVVDVAKSVGVFAPHDPLSNGLLNGAFKDGGDWSSIVRHWAYLRLPLNRLAIIAHTCPDHPRLVLQSLGTQNLKGASANPIVSLDIADMQHLEERDPTGRRSIERQLIAPPEVATENSSCSRTTTAQVIGFVRPSKDNPP